MDHTSRGYVGTLHHVGRGGGGGVLQELINPKANVQLINSLDPLASSWTQPVQVTMNWRIDDLTLGSARISSDRLVHLSMAVGHRNYFFLIKCLTFLSKLTRTTKRICNATTTATTRGFFINVVHWDNFFLVMCQALADLSSWVNLSPLVVVTF